MKSLVRWNSSTSTPVSRQSSTELDRYRAGSKPGQSRVKAGSKPGQSNSQSGPNTSQGHALSCTTPLRLAWPRRHNGAASVVRPLAKGGRPTLELQCHG